MKRTIRNAALGVAALALAGAAFVYAGLYNIAADEPHWGITTSAIEILRTRSIERRARAIQVPRLDDPQLSRKGAGQYAEMCVTCHLAPGVSDSPTRDGLYPLPPKLAERSIDPRTAFWIIKHGIKMTGMPAWGPSHDDQTIWSLVAFLQQLPKLSPAQYKAMVTTAPRDQEMADMPGMSGAAVNSHAAEEAPHK